MSLINDALKRAKEAQPPLTPPVGGPPLKPVDPAIAKAAGTTKMMIYIIVACVIAGNILLFIAVSDRGAKKAAAANPPPVAQGIPVVSDQPAPTPPAAPPAVHNPAPAPVPAPQSVTIAAATPEPVAPVTAAETNAIATADTATVEPASVQIESPKPAPLKLQSIIINPSRPSAMISGKFLFIGDRIQGWRVTAIDQENVTLVGNGQTNVLSLP